MENSVTVISRSKHLTPYSSYWSNSLNTSQMSVVLNVSMSVSFTKASNLEMPLIGRNRNTGIITDRPMFSISHCLM